MKKKIFGAVIIAAMALAASWNFNQSKNDVALSDLALDNVEALARGEGCENKPGQNNGICVTNGKGDYFCANSSSSTDCVK